MSKLPSFEQFNESIKNAVINEGVFHRLPKNIISDELYLTAKNLHNFYDRTAAGNDVDPGVIDTIIRGLDKVKKAVKKFNSKEEVAGTVYEAEKMVFDEIGTELEALQKKILDLMRNTTDSKWRTALGSASTALSNLDRNLSQADSKLGVIPMKESEEVNEAKEIVLHGNQDDIQEFYDEISNDDDWMTTSKTDTTITIKYPGSQSDKNDLLKYAKNYKLSESEKVNEASVQIAGKSKPSGAQVLATVIIEHLMKNEYLKPGADKVKKELISDVQQVIMDSTF